jgi:hypothetical protein
MKFGLERSLRLYQHMERHGCVDQSLLPSGYRICEFRNTPPGPARNKIEAPISESSIKRSAGLDISMPNSDFWCSFDSPAVISLGEMPGAIELTRILASSNVVAIILVKMNKSSLPRRNQPNYQGAKDLTTSEIYQRLPLAILDDSAPEYMFCLSLLSPV